MTDSQEKIKYGRMSSWREDGGGSSVGLPSLHEPSFVSKISNVVKNVAISARRRSSILFDSDADSNHRPKLNRGIDVVLKTGALHALISTSPLYRSFRATSRPTTISQGGDASS
jgi:hypothetical protein